MSYLGAFITTFIGFMLTVIIGLYLFPIPEGEKSMNFQLFLVITLLLHILTEVKQIKK